METLMWLIWATIIFGGTGLAFGLWLSRGLTVLRANLDVVFCLVLSGAIVGTFWFGAYLAGAYGTLAEILGFLTAGFAAGWYHVRSKGRKRVRVIGITGTIGSGKSLVGKLLAEMGVTVIDTDHVYHRLLAESDTLKASLRARFGDAIFAADGSVNRKQLGAIVFADKVALADLNRIAHPAILAECRRMTAAVPSTKLVALLVPLLFEAGLEGEYDEVWTVIASEAVVRERIKSRDKLSDDEVSRRLKAQYPQDEKARRSHRVIDNSGTVDETRAVVKAIVDELAG